MTGNAESSRCPHWPAVAVVMPVRGFHAHTASNWATHITADYAGPVEFLIVVESEADLAYREACKLAARFNAAHKLAGVTATHPEAEFVLFLDDDARMYPEAITYLVTDMLCRPDTFLVTGYPFDIPNPGSLFSYAVLGFHLVPLVNFSYDAGTEYIWGGCMMLRLGDFRSNRLGMVDVLRQGGYSDDMTLGAFWSYLRRQLFALTTYFSPLNRRLNLWLLLMGMAFSSVMVGSMAVSLSFLVQYLLPCVAGSAAWVFQMVGSFGAAAPVCEVPVVGVASHSHSFTLLRLPSPLSPSVQ
ncbi:unnamed protein product [Closterium sp. NIES-65]|nr:unnamed protein product [Closterium sp. NIES-65]